MKRIYFLPIVLIILGCASSVPEIKFMPKESDAVFPFFTSGQPIAAVQSKDAFMLLSLEPTVLPGGRYFRLWFLYQNTSEKPYLLEPMSFISLNVTLIAKRKAGTTNPESPTKILADISNDKAIKMIMQSIGGTLKEMAVKPTTAKTRFNDGASATTTFNDQGQKRDLVADQTATAISNTAMWMIFFKIALATEFLEKIPFFQARALMDAFTFPFLLLANLILWIMRVSIPVLNIF